MIATGLTRSPLTTIFSQTLKKSTTAPVNSTGMIRTAFRSSDDSCVYGFLIPSEMEAVQALAALSDVARVMNDSSLEAGAKQIQLEIHNGIQRFGVIYKKRRGGVLRLRNGWFRRLCRDG